MNLQGMLVAVILAVGLMTLTAPAVVNGAEQEPIVIDDLTLPQLRTEIEKIQTEFYKVFNSLNDADEFDIVCQRFIPTGSNIPQFGCEPKFMTERRGDNANDYRLGIDELMSSEGLLKELQPKFEELAVKINGFAGENDYFRELNQILRMLTARLNELSQ